MSATQTWRYAFLAISISAAALTIAVSKNTKSNSIFTEKENRIVALKHYRIELYKTLSSGEYVDFLNRVAMHKIYNLGKKCNIGWKFLNEFNDNYLSDVTINARHEIINFSSEYDFINLSCNDFNKYVHECKVHHCNWSSIWLENWVKQFDEGENKQKTVRAAPQPATGQTTSSPQQRFESPLTTGGACLREEVASSFIASIGFCVEGRDAAGANEDDEGVVSVTMSEGNVYQYSGVERSVFDKFVSAPSKGRFFNAEIKPHYPCRWISGPRHSPRNCP